MIDSLVESMAMGGTRMTPFISEQEVRNLARAMTIKLALAGLPIGGAKAGIRAVPGHKEQVLRSFGRAISPFLHGGVYLGCDQGTTHADRDFFFSAAGYDVLRDHKIPCFPTSWTRFWDRLADITGFGVTVSILTALQEMQRHGPQRVVIQGFGTVGRSVARHLARKGHHIVGVADVLGTIRAAELPVEDLVAVTDSAGTIDRSRLPSSVTVLAGSEAWLDVAADVLVLAAGGDSIRADNVSRIAAEIVVEGGNLCCTPGAQQHMADAAIVVVPGVVANVGGAAATGCVLARLIPFDLPLTQMAAWLFDWVEKRVQANTRDVLAIAALGEPDPVQALLASRARP